MICLLVGAGLVAVVATAIRLTERDEPLDLTEMAAWDRQTVALRKATRQ